MTWLRLCGVKANEIERKENEMRLTSERMLFITVSLSKRCMYSTVFCIVYFDCLIACYLAYCISSVRCPVSGVRYRSLTRKSSKNLLAPPVVRVEIKNDAVVTSCDENQPTLTWIINSTDQFRARSSTEQM